MNASSPKIAVLGPRQSGKTCLAIGLSAVNSEKLVVQPGGGADDNVLATLRQSLCSDKNRPGKWPEANNKGDIHQVGLTIRKGKKEATVSFIGYAGERLQSNEDFSKFANQYLGGLDGAIVLVNPGSDAFSGDATKREDTFTVYQRILEYLRNLPTHPFVALTVTACDRLDGDLKNRKSDVDSFVKKLENILGNSGKSSKTLQWTRKNVTITGHLDNQDVPRLAESEENTSWEPFDWLLEKTVWADRRRAIRRIIRRAVIAAFVAVAVAFVWCTVDASKDKREILDTKQKCITLLNEFRAERDSTKGYLDDAIKTNNSLYNNEWSWNRPFAQSTAGNLDREKVWKAVEDRLNYLKRNVERDGYLEDIGNLLRDYTPLTEVTKKRKEQWNTSWEKEKPRLVEKINQNKIITPIDVLLSRLHGEYGEHVWTALVTNHISLAKLQLGGAPKEFVEKCDATKSKLDERIAEEGKRLVGDFEQAASTNASLMATRSFAEKLGGWTPVTTNGATARGELLASVSNSMPIWRTTYEMDGISNRVIRPMLDERDHDATALSRLYPLYEGFDATDETDADASLSTFLNNARLELDNRIADDWKSHILPTFDKAAATGATAEAVKELTRQLEDWKPATTNGIAARTDLQTTVSKSIPVWRGVYEREEYAKKLDKAVSSENLAELAAVSPGRYPANEFLKAETISTLWDKTGKPAFEKARTVFVSEIVNGAVAFARQKRPELSDRDREKIHRKVIEVGNPLDESLLLADVTKAIQPKIDAWNEERRTECRKWLGDRKDFSPIDLMKEYRRVAAGRMGKENPFFSEIISSNVYGKAEKCLSRYVEVFEGEFRPAKGPSIWDDTENLAVRYKELHRHFQEFRDMCRTIQDIDKPPVSTWAYRFAQLCMDPNHGNLDAGNIAKAFPQRLSIEKVVMSADYHGKLPTYYKYTAFAARICVTNFTPKGEVSSGSTTVLLPFDKDNRSAKDDEGNAMRASDKKNDVRQREIHPATPWLVDIHLGERVVLQTVATDYNKGTGERQSSKFKEFPLPWGGRETLRSAGNVYDLSFKVKPSIGRWESSKDATCSLTIYGHVKGYSMIDLLKLAQEDPAGNK